MTRLVCAVTIHQHGISMESVYAALPFTKLRRRFAENPPLFAPGEPARHHLPNFPSDRMENGDRSRVNGISSTGQLPARILASSISSWFCRRYSLGRAQNFSHRTSSSPAFTERAAITPQCSRYPAFESRRPTQITKFRTFEESPRVSSLSVAR